MSGFELASSGRISDALNPGAIFLALKQTILFFSFFYCFHGTMNFLHSASFLLSPLLPFLFPPSQFTQERTLGEPYMDPLRKDRNRQFLIELSTGLGDCQQGPYSFFPRVSPTSPARKRMFATPHDSPVVIYRLRDVWPMEPSAWLFGLNAR